MKKSDNPMVLNDTTISIKPAGGYCLLTFSAAHANDLENMSAALMDYFKSNPGLNINDSAYTLAMTGAGMLHRRFLVCENAMQAGNKLNDREEGFKTYCRTNDPAPVLMFPGGGAQHINMARRLYYSEVYFRQVVDEGLHYVCETGGENYFDLLYPADTLENKEITDTEIALPLLFIIEYALARFITHLGVKPKALIGHSLGEYVAACVAGVFTYQDALKLVLHRGRLMKKVEPGLMLSVGAGINRIERFLNDSVSVGAINSPGNCMLSGSKPDIERLKIVFDRNDIQTRIIHIAVASHSFMMDPILEEFKAVFQTIKINKPVIPVISNLSGDWIQNTEADANYWSRHLRGTVRFSNGVSRILSEIPDTLFIEAGPGNTLSNLLAQHVGASSGRRSVNLLKHPLNELADDHFFLNALGDLWLYGCDISWENYFYNEHRKVMPELASIVNVEAQRNIPEIHNSVDAQTGEFAYGFQELTGREEKIEMAKSNIGKMRAITRK